MNPEDLLAQLRDLLQQYMALGPDTPVAQQAGDLLAAIEATGGGEGDMGSMGMASMPPPPADMAMGGEPAAEPAEAPIPVEAPAPSASRRGGSADTAGFDEARAGAKEFLKKRKGSKAA